MTTLKALEYTHRHPTSNNTKDPLIKSIVKYRNDPCIFATGEIRNSTHEPPFSSSNNDRKGMLLEIRILSPLKASQDTDTPTKVLKLIQIFLPILFSQVPVAPSEVWYFHLF